MSYRIQISFLILLIVFSCHGKPEEERALVRAWDKPLISAQAFESRLAEESSECQNSTDPSCLALREQLLNQMIEEALLLRLAEKRGLEISTTELEQAERDILGDYEGSEDMLQQLGHYPEDWRSSIHERLMVHGLFEEGLQGINVNQGEVLAYYTDHRELFVRPREVRVRQIVVARGDEAVEILERLKKGEDFTRLAMEYSLSPEAANGGDLGFLRPGQMPPELEDVVFSLEIGEISDVTSSPYGFHIVRVEERLEPRELDFSEVGFRIHRRLLLDQVRKAYRTWIQEMREEAGVEILDSDSEPNADEGENLS